MRGRLTVSQSPADTDQRGDDQSSRPLLISSPGSRVRNRLGREKRDQAADPDEERRVVADEDRCRGTPARSVVVGIEVVELRAKTNIPPSSAHITQRDELHLAARGACSASTIRRRSAWCRPAPASAESTCSVSAPRVTAIEQSDRDEVGERVVEVVGETAEDDLRQAGPPTAGRTARARAAAGPAGRCPPSCRSPRSAGRRPGARRARSPPPRPAPRPCRRRDPHRDRVPASPRLAPQPTSRPTTTPPDNQPDRA